MGLYLTLILKRETSDFVLFNSILFTLLIILTKETGANIRVMRVHLHFALYPLLNIPLLDFSPDCCRKQIPHLSLSVCRCQQTLNNRWDPHPFGLSHLMLLIDCQHASGYVAQMGWRTCVFHPVTPARRAFVKTTGHSAKPRGKLGYQKVVCSNRKLDKWNVSPPPTSSSSWLLDLHCYVKDERSRLPGVKYRLLSSFVPSALLVCPLAACLFDCKTCLLFLLSHFCHILKWHWR